MVCQHIEGINLKTGQKIYGAFKKEMITMSKTTVKMYMIKQELRRAGLPTRGVLAQEFQNMNFEQEKKWHQIKTKAHNRTEELAKTFPFAFGEYKKTQYDAEFLNRFFQERR
ncbi:MAG: hypothetical protein K0B07_02365 [DPANN group archaeon]|nr:hypothetical protein [DPANN group archaeon]